MNIEEIAFKDRAELAHLNGIDLLNIIEFLQKDRQQCINQFSKTHNESVEIQAKNKKLNGAIQTYDILLKANVEENKRLKDNWNKLEKWIYEKHCLYIPEIAKNSTYQLVFSKMQELEGSDINVKD